MGLDALIISDSGSDSFSGTNPLKLRLEGRVADVQTVLNFLHNGGALRAPISGEELSNWASAPKLNGLYLHSYLSRQGFEIVCISNFFDDSPDLRRALEANPTAVVISTTFIIDKATLTRMVKEIRARAPGAKIIIGGPFVYTSYLIYHRTLADSEYLPREAFSEFLFMGEDPAPGADLYVVSARGENTLCEALRRLRQGLPLEHLPNTAVFENGAYAFGPQNGEDCSELPDIDWSCLPDRVFDAGVVPLQASQGCPFNCAFCNFVRNKRMAAVKPLDRLVEELKAVRARGARYIWFVDDNFRLGRNDLEKVCQRFIQEDLGLRWMTFIRASTLDRMDAGLLRRAGCIEVQLGLESADAQVLKNMNKRATPELYERVLPKLLAAGINCSCYLIFGFPGETDQSARHTIDFIRRHENAEHPGTLNWSIFPFFLAPLSPIYEANARQTYGISGCLKTWRHNTMDSERAMHYVITAYMAMQRSGAIYRSDNQDLLARLTGTQRRDFKAARHALSKAALQGELGNATILSSFGKALRGGPPFGNQG